MKNTSTGKIYTITVIGCSDPTKQLTMKGTITPNIVRIEDFALKHPYNIIKMDENTELKYYGAYAYGHYLSSLKIAENGVFKYQVNPIGCLELGKGAELRVDNNRAFDPESVKALFNFRGTESTMTIYNHSRVPQKIQSDVLDNPPFFIDERNYKSSTLYVPVGCIEAYRNDPEWSKFENILEFDPMDRPLSAIDGVKDDAPDNFIISAEPGRIILEAETSGAVDIYSLQGLLIEHKSLVSGRNEIPVQKGLYIVKPIPGWAKKILVP